jgi:hypothetical protein
VFSLQQNQRRWNRFCLKMGAWGEVALTMYTHMNKCKTYKIKREKEKKESF